MMQNPKIKNSEILHSNGISSLCFSKNGAYCAIATKKNIRVYIFEIKTFNDINTWNIIQQLSDHTQLVSDIDWSDDQKIITASHDRSVFVWKKNNLKWDKMLVNIEVKLSILASKWAPSCKKFALGSCPNTLTLGFYSPQAKCWTATVKDKITKSPIISLDFHKSSNILAIGSVDGSVKIITSSFKKSTDPNVIQAKVEDYPYSGQFQKIDTMFQTLFSIENILPNMNMWINHVSFQANGKYLLVLPHCNHIKIFQVSQGPSILINQKDIQHKGLPYMNGFIHNEKANLLLAGFDRKVSLFTKDGNNLFISGDTYKFSRNLDKNQKTNTIKKKGLVQHLTKGIEKKEWYFGEPPALDQHQNMTKVVKTRNSYVSYDLNGIVHFWE